MGRYRKLFAAMIFFAVMIALQYYQITIPGFSPLVLDMLVGALGSFGVYQVRNDA